MIQLNETGISLFGVFIRWYGIIIASAVLIAVILCTIREKKCGLPGETCIDLALIVVPCGIIGARIYYVLFNLDYYLQKPIEILYIHQGGLAIYGGIIAGLLGTAVYSLVKKLKFFKIADLVAPALALAQAMGRWGNFFNQEAYGRQILDPKWQFFPAAVQLNSGTWHYATFFYESMWCLMICIVLLIWERTRCKRRDGDMFFAYAFLYAAERIVVEGLRMDSLYIGSFRVSQIFSLLILIVLSIVLYTRTGSRGIMLKVIHFISLIIYGCTVILLPILYAVPFGLLMIVLAAAVYLIKDKRVIEKR